MHKNLQTESYQSYRKSQAAISRKRSEEGRDIGDIPPIADTDRRDRAEGDFEFFCRTYFPATFNLAWSNDHRRAIQRIQTATREGGLFAYAMPRGSGKTSLAECAVLWATLCGYREFILFIGSDEGSGLASLESIKTEIETNDLLLEDFPEVCFPIRALEGIPHRCNGQTYKGQRTHIGWTAKEIIYPTIPGSKASGAVIKATGITGRIRGMSFKRPDGKKVRPSMVVIDDPQTDESARSPSQCAQRVAILNGAILGLAGPGRKIAGVMPCTVIAKGDMADELLDKNKNPQWQGERTKMMYSFPANTKLWDQYAQIRADSFRAGNDGKDATAFYQANREAMDAGAEAAWPVRFNPDEISAIQHAMNLRLRDERAFFAEYQNDPMPEVIDSELMTANEIAAKVNGLKRYVVPMNCEHVTAFIDIQANMLFYLVLATGQKFNGAVIDYNAWPDQKRNYWTKADAKHTFARLWPTMGQEGQIYKALESLVSDLMARDWVREDGSAMKIERLLIDCNWGTHTDLVYQFCRQSPHAAIITPARGRYVGASHVPWDQFKQKDGERLGYHWMMPSLKGKRAIRHLENDVNFWKSFVHARFKTAIGDPGCFTLWGKADEHRLIADHLCSEYRVRTQGRGRTVDEWHAKPGKPDNEGLDAIVGATVAASFQGVRLEQNATAKAAPKKVVRQRVSYLA